MKMTTKKYLKRRQDIDLKKDLVEAFYSPFI